MSDRRGETFSTAACTWYGYWHIRSPLRRHYPDNDGSAAGGEDHLPHCRIASDGNSLWMAGRSKRLSSRKKFGTPVIPSHMEALSRNRAGLRGRTGRRPVLSSRQPAEQQVQSFCDNLGQ
jgi:hypothetical protein